MSKKYIVIISAVLIFALIISAAMLKKEDTAYSLEAGKRANEPFCFLVLGHDRVSGLCDVMMLACFDTANERMTVMQIPRDTYADYGSKGHKKLNTAAKLLGGERELCRYLSKSMGITVDGYISFELEGFRKAVDAIGGVEIELEQPLDYEDPHQSLYIHLPAGKQVLDGKKAEMLVRFRNGYLRGDLDRLDVQKRFLAAVFAKLKSTVNVGTAYKLITEVIGYTKTDIALPLALALGVKALGVEPAELRFLTLPGAAVYSHKSGASYYAISASATAEVLEEYFFAQPDSFDRERLFRHPENDSFSRVYDGYTEYEISYGDRVGSVS